MTAATVPAGWVQLRCPRPDCSNTFPAAPGTTATCWRHARGEVMKPYTDHPAAKENNAA